MRRTRFILNKIPGAFTNPAYITLCIVFGVWEPEELLPATEVGWFVDRRHWGAGLATEGGRRSLAFGFKELGLERIIARYNPENLASGRVMEKLGMRHACDMPRSDGPGIARVFEFRAN